MRVLVTFGSAGGGTEGLARRWRKVCAMKDSASIWCQPAVI
jgi:hypothetical protein